MDKEPGRSIANVIPDVIHRYAAIVLLVTDEDHVYHAGSLSFVACAACGLRSQIRDVRMLGSNVLI
jgi:hypothetical protein